MNTAIQEAVGAPGEPGKPEHIAYVARKIAACHRRLLEWTGDFNDADVRARCRRILELVARFSEDTIHQLEAIPIRLHSEIVKAADAKQKGNIYEAKVMLVLSLPVDDHLVQEFEQLTSWVVEHAYDSDSEDD